MSSLLCDSKFAYERTEKAEPDEAVNSSIGQSIRDRSDRMYVTALNRDLRRLSNR